MFENTDQSLEAWDRLIAELHRVWNRTRRGPPRPAVTGAGVVVAQDRRFRQQLQLVLTRCGMSVVTEQQCSALSQRNDWSLVVIDQRSLDEEAREWLSDAGSGRPLLRVLIAEDREFARRSYEARLADWTYIAPFPVELLASRLVRHLGR